MGDFTVEQYAKYVIDNIHRATLVNSLRIPEKLKLFDMNDFIDCSMKYISELVSSGKLDNEKASRASVAFYNCRNDLNSKFNYNKTMVVNDLIINLWEIFK